jgi:hypothetical protein
MIICGIYIFLYKKEKKYRKPFFSFLRFEWKIYENENPKF